MLIQCPKGHVCQWSDRKCPKCDFEFTLGNMLHHYGRRLASRMRRRAVIACPHCQKPVPLTASTCPRCKEQVSFDDAYEIAVKPARRRFRRFRAEMSPRTARLLRLSYFSISAVVLWRLLAFVEAQVGEGWVGHAALSIVYLAVLLLGVLLFVPRQRLQWMAQHPSVSDKLALTMNCLCLLLLLQIFIGEWWVRSLVLAGLFLIVWLAFYVLFEWLLPMVAKVRSCYLPEDNKQHDHTAPQGRRASWN